MWEMMYNGPVWGFFIEEISAENGNQVVGPNTALLQWSWSFDNDDGDGIIWFDKQNDDFNKFDILDGAETWLAFKI